MAVVYHIGWCIHRTSSLLQRVLLDGNAPPESRAKCEEDPAWSLMEYQSSIQGVGQMEVSGKDAKKEQSEICTITQ